MEEEIKIPLTPKELKAKRKAIKEYREKHPEYREYEKQKAKEYRLANKVKYAAYMRAYRKGEERPKFKEEEEEIPRKVLQVIRGKKRFKEFCEEQSIHI